MILSRGSRKHPLKDQSLGKLQIIGRSLTIGETSGERADFPRGDQTPLRSGGVSTARCYAQAP
jgi:hypothetical protein